MTFIQFLKNTKAVLFFYTKRFSLYRYFFLPIKKNQFFFDSFNGRSFTCSPKYLYLYFTEHGVVKPENCIWACRDKEAFRKQIDSERVKLVEYGSGEYIKACMTSKILIINSTIPAVIPIRKNQCLINTWHGGGAYKKSGMADESDVFFTKKLLFKKKAAQTKYFLNSCRRYGEIVENSFLISTKKNVPSGLPRNDFLVVRDFNKESLFQKICGEIKQLAAFDLSKKLLVLYAPTCRTSNGSVIDLKDSILSLDEIKYALSTRFHKEPVFLFRTHYEDLFSRNFGNIINVSDWPDMQELIAVADILVTDYSSSVWDFGLTGRPCFLYVPDLEQYSNARNFYTPIDEWPFPKAKSVAEMTDVILSFNQENYLMRLKKHYDDLGSYETGTACKTVSELVKKELEK